MNYLLLLLPIMTQAHISIRIKASDDAENGKVECDGSDENIITDQDRNTFRISDEILKAAATKHFGSRPNSVYLKDPTPMGEVYKNNNWNQVTRRLSALWGTIQGVSSQPVIMNKQVFTNNSTNEVKYMAQISQIIEDTVSQTWSTSHEFSLGQEISYSCEFAGVGVSGSTSISYTASFGQETTQSKAITVGSSTGIEVPLKPGEVAEAYLSADRGTMHIEVQYLAMLRGGAVCRYENQHKGHNNWKADINNLLKAVDLPRQLFSKQHIEVGFYSHVNAVVKSV